MKRVLNDTVKKKNYAVHAAPLLARCCNSTTISATARLVTVAVPYAWAPSNQRLIQERK
jgi:hypothetical protein